MTDLSLKDMLGAFIFAILAIARPQDVPGGVVASTGRTDRAFDIRDFGATGDGVTKDTIAVQRALDACVGTGGRVIVPAGTYLIGSVFLKDDTELHMEKGAILLGSPDLQDYNADDAYPQNFGSKAEGWSAKHLLLAIEARNVSVTGEGVIDGNGASFMKEPSARMPRYDVVWRHGFLRASGRQEGLRPGQELVFIECENVRVEGVTLRNMAMWTCFFHGCDTVTIRNVRIRNDLRFAETDGFDIDTCRNVFASGCDIVSGDDAFAVRCSPQRLRNKSKRVCENVVISNCTSATAASGIRIGVGDGLVRNVRVRDCRIKEAGHALLVQGKYPTTKCEGLDVDGVEFQDIAIDESPAPILVLAGTPDAKATMRNVAFRRVKAKMCGRVLVSGAKRLRPDGIILEDVDLEVTKPPKPVMKDWELGELTPDMSVIAVKEADNVTFRNVKVSVRDGLFRPRLEVADANSFADSAGTHPAKSP